MPKDVKVMECLSLPPIDRNPSPAISTWAHGFQTEKHYRLDTPCSFSVPNQWFPLNNEPSFEWHTFDKPENKLQNSAVRLFRDE
jgi:hypothetical protein